MTLPRSKYVREGEEGVYHCFSRCVRRAFLCGIDKLTLRDFSHRKAWLVDRLRHLAGIFAIEVCAYAIMETHYHTVLRIRPDIVATWSDYEVAIRWLTLFPRHRDSRDISHPVAEQCIRALADDADRIAKLRKRLCSLSWFMGRLNEFIARAANREDQVKGRFWESRFKCQVLLDIASITSCMVYVDLNPVRSGVAATPEESDFTSIQERIRAWRQEILGEGFAPEEVGAHPRCRTSTGMKMTLPGIDLDIHHAMAGQSAELTTAPANWLCPVESESGRRGILQITATEYFDLVDKSGRMIRSDKKGAIDADIAPILLRIGAKPETWLKTVSQFGSKFHLAAGLVSSLRKYAGRLGRCWLQGVTTARAAFASTLPT